MEMGLDLRVLESFSSLKDCVISVTAAPRHPSSSLHNSCQYRSVSTRSPATPSVRCHICSFSGPFRGGDSSTTLQRLDYLQYNEFPDFLFAFSARGCAEQWRQGLNGPLREQPPLEGASGGSRDDRKPLSEPARHGCSWGAAFRLNWTLGRATLQMFYVALYLYWCCKTKAHLIRIKIIVRRKWSLRVMDCERIEGLMGLGVFIKMKIMFINPPNYLLSQPHKC